TLVAKGRTLARSVRQHCGVPRRRFPESEGSLSEESTPERKRGPAAAELTNDVARVHRRIQGQSQCMGGRTVPAGQSLRPAEPRNTTPKVPPRSLRSRLRRASVRGPSRAKVLRPPLTQMSIRRVCTRNLASECRGTGSSRRLLRPYLRAAFVD